MRASRVHRLFRGLLAAAVACSWLLMAGLPAAALVTGSSVQSPKAGAALAKAKPLVVAVDRAKTDEEKITVGTRLFYGGLPTPPPQEPEPSEPPPDDEGDDGDDGDATVQQEESQQAQQQEPAQPKPVSKKVLGLRFIDRKDTTTGETLRFGGAIDPYNLAWLPDGGVAANGQYTLEYLVDSTATEGETWQRFEFRIDAPPPPQGTPGVGVQDPDTKKMIVAWQRNAAPDITSYTVERRLDSGEWRVAKEKIKPGTTQITDTVPKYGSYQYRVAAIRPSGSNAEKSRATVSTPSQKVTIQEQSQITPPSSDDDDPVSAGQDGSGTTTTSPGTSNGSGTGSAPSLSGSPSTSGGFGTTTDDLGEEPGVAMPRGFDDTFQGPLDYNVQQDEVTERVPVEVAQGGTSEDGGTLTVLDRAVDQQRVLPPLAGGLILVLSAAHVLRYLNE